MMRANLKHLQFQISTKNLQKIFGDHPHHRNLATDLWICGFNQTCGKTSKPTTFEEGKKKKAAKDPNRPKKPTGGAYGALVALASPKFGPFRLGPLLGGKDSWINGKFHSWFLSYSNISFDIGFGFWDGWFLPNWEFKYLMFIWEDFFRTFPLWMENCPNEKVTLSETMKPRCFLGSEQSRVDEESAQGCFCWRFQEWMHWKKSDQTSWSAEGLHRWGNWWICTTSPKLTILLCTAKLQWLDA